MEGSYDRSFLFEQDYVEFMLNEGNGVSGHEGNDEHEDVAGNSASVNRKCTDVDSRKDRDASDDTVTEAASAAAATNSVRECKGRKKCTQRNQLVTMLSGVVETIWKPC